MKRASQRWNIQVALKALGSPKRLLDIGCGPGQFLALARERGHRVAGLDFNPESLRLGREVFGLADLFCGSLEQFVQNEGRKFDAVVALEVLEHTEQPIEFLRQTARVLLPGGRLYLSVPGWDRWPRIFDPEADFPPHHLTLWTEQALAQALERAGFTCEGVVRSSLQHEDLLRHINTRLQRMLFPRSQARREAAHEDGRAREPGLAWRVYCRLAATTARELVRLSFHLPAALLRLHPRAGGFGLFCVAFKR
ncbi:MAG: class I SAM-dependent methyltransferase [Terriglobia bacterium]